MATFTELKDRFIVLVPFTTEHVLYLPCGSDSEHYVDFYWVDIPKEFKSKRCGNHELIPCCKAMGVRDENDEVISIQLILYKPEWKFISRNPRQ